MTSWTDVFTTGYVWDEELRDWVSGEETGPVRDGESFTAYSDEEFFEACAADQPDPATRELAGIQESCTAKGTTTWTDTYTADYVWEPVDRAWVPGEETGPVRTEEFVAYSAAEYEEACVDLEGLEESDDDSESEVVPQDEAEVTGTQAAVPTVIDAGGSASGPSGSTGDRLWLFAFGGALLTLGFTGDPPASHGSPVTDTGESSSRWPMTGS